MRQRPGASAADQSYLEAHGHGDSWTKPAPTGSPAAKPLDGLSLPPGAVSASPSFPPPSVVQKPLRICHFGASSDLKNDSMGLDVGAVAFPGGQWLTGVGGDAEGGFWDCSHPISFLGAGYLVSSVVNTHDWALMCTFLMTSILYR